MSGLAKDSTNAWFRLSTRCIVVSVCLQQANKMRPLFPTTLSTDLLLLEGRQSQSQMAIGTYTQRVYSHTVGPLVCSPV